MADNGGVIFSRAAAERIANAVRTVERNVQGGDGRGKRRIPIYTGGGAWYFAYTPSAGIGARVGVPPANITPNSGTCRLYQWTGSVLTLLSDTITVRNPWAAAIGGSRLIRVEATDGQWWVVNEDCSGSTAATQQSVNGFGSTAFSSGFASTAGTSTGAVSTAAFSGGFGLTGFGGSGFVPAGPTPP